MTEEKASVTINIHGGNNHILPNATHAEQHFHYHTTEAAEPPSRTRTRIYNNVEIDAEYIDKFSRCCTASDLAKVVVEMVRDDSIPYLDSVLAVKADFFTRLLPFCPNLNKEEDMMKEAKPFVIDKTLIYKAFLKVKENKGSAGAS